MSQAVLRVDNNGVSATLVLLDHKGNAAVAASPPTWSMDIDTVVSMNVSSDGMSAQFAPKAVGTANVNVVIEGDSTPGVDTLHATGSIQVLAAEAATASLTFGPVT